MLRTFSDEEISLLRAKRQGEVFITYGSQRAFIRVELTQEELRLWNKKWYFEKYGLNLSNYEEVQKICYDAHLHPEQIVCYCTSTRADEVAATILQGADTPDKISQRTGLRLNVLS
ncbi:hypothetical protein [Neobacillus cucumis]|uniref:hypothetical protein n=1 Tax=Neobacillus cucumis TaxID=1740721 RepID=UPI0028536453|nr:hypothetical protein [Neobacillus cucumis]MDR4949409.1 hypothetical protein [Neobacillus cucumis]